MSEQIYEEQKTFCVILKSLFGVIGMLSVACMDHSFLLKEVKIVLFSYLRLNFLCFVGSYY